MICSRFIEPLDVLFLRGNRLFGDAGSFGESMVPPWPSVIAGALRSAILASEGVDLQDYAHGRFAHGELGTPEKPGSFVLLHVDLARCRDGEIGTLHQLPADLVAWRQSESLVTGRARPIRPAAGVLSSSLHPLSPVLAQDTPSRPTGSWWMSGEAWLRYLNGETPTSKDLVSSAELWAIDHRVGIALHADERRAEDGKLFSMQAVALNDGLGNRSATGQVGFLAVVAGATVPDSGVLRLGGDGRAASFRTAQVSGIDYPVDEVLRSRRCRIVLTSPGIFEGGWRLPGMHSDGTIELGGIRGRVVASSIRRFEIVSGWDLARNSPKPAMRAASVGSVYWIEDLDCDAGALERLLERGLWSDGDYPHNPRRAEGFNRFALAVH
ncbi:MAG: hypothetical protein KJZ83_06480 [Burkholderiaceae bacterium]|nr:hypothetical protein [Burkholderiaceae bacterium]